MAQYHRCASTQLTNLTDFTHILQPATGTIPQQQRHEHKPRCTRDRILYLPRVPFACAFGRVLVDHQASTVHSKFLVPYFQLFEMTIKLLLATPEWLYSSISITTSHVRTLLQDSRTAMRGTSRGNRLLHATHGLGSATAPDGRTLVLLRAVYYLHAAE